MVIFICSVKNSDSCVNVTDWKARADVVKLLKHLKKELTILVVSHDLKYVIFLNNSNLIRICYRVCFSTSNFGSDIVQF